LIHKRGQSAITLLKLADQSLAGASFTSVAELRAHIDTFVDTYNEQAKPFACTKSEVYQKRLKARFADQ